MNFIPMCFGTPFRLLLLLLTAAMSPLAAQSTPQRVWQKELAAVSLPASQAEAIKRGFANKDTAQAYKACMEWKEASPSNPAAYLWLAAIAIDDGAPALAISTTQEALGMKMTRSALQTRYLLLLKADAHDRLGESSLAYQTEIQIPGREDEKINDRWFDLFAEVHGPITGDRAALTCGKLLTPGMDSGDARLLLAALASMGEQELAAPFWEGHDKAQLPATLRMPYMDYLASKMDAGPFKARVKAAKLIRQAHRENPPPKELAKRALLIRMLADTLFLRSPWGDDSKKAHFSETATVEKKLTQLETAYADNQVAYRAFYMAVSEASAEIRRTNNMDKRMALAAKRAPTLTTQAVALIKAINKSNNIRTYWQIWVPQAEAALKNTPANSLERKALSALVARTKKTLKYETVLGGIRGGVRDYLYDVVEMHQIADGLQLTARPSARAEDAGKTFALTTYFLARGANNRQIWAMRLKAYQDLGDRVGTVQTAVQLLRRFQMDGDLSTWMDIVATFKASAQSHYENARLLMKQGKAKDAYPHILRARGCDPAEPKFIEKAYEISLECGDLESAVVQLRDAWRAGACRKLDLLRAAELARAAGDYQLFMAISVEALRQAPSDDQAKLLYVQGCCAWNMPDLAAVVIPTMSDPQLQAAARLAYYGYGIPFKGGWSQGVAPPRFTLWDSKVRADSAAKAGIKLNDHAQWLPILYALRYANPVGDKTTAAKKRRQNQLKTLLDRFTAKPMASHLSYVAGTSTATAYKRHLKTAQDRTLADFLIAFRTYAWTGKDNQVRKAALAVVEHTKLPTELRLFARGIAVFTGAPGYTPISSADPVLIGSWKSLTSEKAKMKLGYQVIAPSTAYFNALQQHPGLPILQIADHPGMRDSHISYREAEPVFLPKSQVLAKQTAFLKGMERLRVALAEAELTSALPLFNRLMNDTKSREQRAAIIGGFAADTTRICSAGGLADRRRSKYLLQAVTPYLIAKPDEAGFIWFEAGWSFKLDRQDLLTLPKDLLKNMQIYAQSVMANRGSGQNKDAQKRIDAGYIIFKIYGKDSQHRALAEGVARRGGSLSDVRKEIEKHQPIVTASHFNAPPNPPPRVQYRQPARQTQYRAPARRRLSYREIKRRGRAGGWGTSRSIPSSSRSSSWSSQWSSSYRNQVYRQNLNRQISRAMGGY